MNFLRKKIDRPAPRSSCTPSAACARADRRPGRRTRRRASGSPRRPGRQSALVQVSVGQDVTLVVQPLERLLGRTKPRSYRPCARTARTAGAARRARRRRRTGPPRRRRAGRPAPPSSTARCPVRRRWSLVGSDGTGRAEQGPAHCGMVLSSRRYRRGPSPRSSSTSTQSVARASGGTGSLDSSCCGRGGNRSSPAARPAAAPRAARWAARRRRRRSGTARPSSAGGRTASRAAGRTAGTRPLRAR